MISAGENTIDIDRVSCFLSAVMGFAPFIFDLKSNSNINDTIEAFVKVSKVQNSEKLKKNWVSFQTIFALSMLELEFLEVVLSVVIAVVAAISAHLKFFNNCTDSITT